METLNIYTYSRSLYYRSGNLSRCVLVPITTSFSVAYWVPGVGGQSRQGSVHLYLLGGWVKMIIAQRALLLEIIQNTVQ